MNKKSSFLFFLIGAIATICGFLIIDHGTWKFEITFESIGTWIGSLATIGAFFAIFWQFNKQKKELNRPLLIINIINSDTWKEINKHIVIENETKGSGISIYKDIEIKNIGVGASINIDLYNIDDDEFIQFEYSKLNRSIPLIHYIQANMKEKIKTYFTFQESINKNFILFCSDIHGNIYSTLVQIYISMTEYNENIYIQYSFEGSTTFNNYFSSKRKLKKYIKKYKEKNYRK